MRKTIIDKKMRAYSKLMSLFGSTPLATLRGIRPAESVMRKRTAVTIER